MKKIIITSISIAAIFISAFTIKQTTAVDSYTVTTLAGSGQNQYIDGPGKKAAFGSNLNHITADASGNLYVNDGPNLRKISPDGTVNTLFGQSIYDEENNPKKIHNYLYGNGYGIALDKNNNIYTSRTTQTIVKITDEKTATIAAGYGDESGNDDGPAANARFSEPRGICIEQIPITDVLENYRQMGKP
jgi:hypothetical protein